MEERLRFIARLLDGEKMAGLCREFGIFRKTGYKIFKRYKDCGIDGWLVSFMQYDLGYFDAETCRLEPIQDPFRANVLPI